MSVLSIVSILSAFGILLLVFHTDIDNADLSTSLRVCLTTYSSFLPPETFLLSHFPFSISFGLLGDLLVIKSCSFLFIWKCHHLILIFWGECVGLWNPYFYLFIKNFIGKIFIEV